MFLRQAAKKRRFYPAPAVCGFCDTLAAAASCLCLAGFAGRLPAFAAAVGKEGRGRVCRHAVAAYIMHSSFQTASFRIEAV